MFKNKTRLNLCFSVRQNQVTYFASSPDLILFKCLICFSPGEPRIVYREESQTQQHGKAWNRTWLCFLFCAHPNKKKEVSRWILSFSFLKLLGKLWLCCLNFKWRRFHLQVWIPVFSWKNNAKLGPFPDNNTKWSLLSGWCPTPCQPGTLLASVPHLHHQYQCMCMGSNTFLVSGSTTSI